MGQMGLASINEKKSEQVHILHAPTLVDKTAHNECQCHAL